MAKSSKIKQYLLAKHTNILQIYERTLAKMPTKPQKSQNTENNHLIHLFYDSLFEFFGLMGSLNILNSLDTFIVASKWDFSR